MKTIFTTLSVIFFSFFGFSQVGIGITNPNNETALHIVSNGDKKSVLLPYVDLSANRPTGVKGMIIYNEEKKCIEQYDENSSTWVCLYEPPESRTAVKAHFNGVNTDISNPNVGNGIEEWAVLDFNFEDFDNNNDYDTTTGTFTVPNDGFYFVSTKFESGFDSNDNSIKVGIGILVNGTPTDEVEYDHHSSAGGGGRISRQVNTIMKLNQGDEIQVAIKMPDSFGVFTIDGYFGNSNLTIARID